MLNSKKTKSVKSNLDTPTPAMLGHRDFPQKGLDAYNAVKVRWLKHVKTELDCSFMSTFTLF